MAGRFWCLFMVENVAQKNPGRETGGCVVAGQVESVEQEQRIGERISVTLRMISLAADFRLLHRFGTARSARRASW